MTASVEYIPVMPIEYPDEDGKPMAEGDLQRKCLVYATTVLKIYFQNHPNDLEFISSQDVNLPGCVVKSK
ncbi:hypothetical protein [Nostoc sp. ATCC 53789]|uniref:hypothetical protein n=1 Tax=Nostoc sp. ATCC 53789 TaxID=76335 RepID=UPI000E04201C|nr:hypothetical protein [Nostoc sp. ATCC 53789]RCJ35879.1 hypothetical protein A6V25_00760 [Nostoc sp. ATCC 53789]